MPKFRLPYIIIKNPKRNLRFLIDTGASISIINPGICNPIHKKIIPEISIKTLHSVTKCNYLMTFPSFDELNFDKKLIQFAEIKFHDFYDGLIGNNILFPMNPTINYETRKITFNDSTLDLYFDQEEENELKKYAILANENCPEYICNEEMFRTDHLNPEELNKLNFLLKDFDQIFYKEGDNLTFTHKIKHEIKTLNENPIYTKTYRYPEIHRDEVSKQINQMLDSKIIRPSDSPYSAPIWVVPKKKDASGTEKWRIVIDYRKLNEVTINDKFPIPNIEDILDKLGRSMYFTTLDLAKGFHQIEINEKDVRKTAFSTNNGHYEFIRMPFGLKNAPATFQRLMNNILKDFIGKICHVYLDDIIIFSTSLEEHIISVRKIFQTLQNANLKVQLDKSEFLKKETEFLGHIITTEGIKPNPNKIKAIQDFKIPKTTKQIKSFLGLVGYYRKFIKDFAKVAKPLTLRLKKESKINPQDLDYQESFEKLKLLITSEPVLKYPDFNKPFVLTTDASNYAIGSVLSQEGHPTCFASRTLNDHETRYSTIEKELLAIIWSTQYFRPYLYGRPFIIRTDHRPLSWLSNLKEPNSKLQRWKCKLEEYNFKIEYIKGKDNIVADALSRPEININEDDNISIETQHSALEDNTDYIEISELPLNIYKNQIIIKKGRENKVSKKKLMLGKTRKEFIYIEPNSQNYEYILNNHMPQRGIVGILIKDLDMYNEFQNTYIKWKANKVNIKILKCSRLLYDLEYDNLERQILKEHLRNNHRGIDEVYLEMKINYYYPNLKREITRVINNCHICDLAKYERVPIKEPYRSRPMPEGPHNQLSIDIWYLDQQHMFLTLFDRFSKHAQVIPLKTRNWPDVQTALETFFGACGIPKLLIADNDTIFTPNLKNFLDNLEVETHFTTPNSHTGNSDIERFHNTLNEHIRLLSSQDVHKLSKINFVAPATRYYNNTIHSTTQQKPINIHLGQLNNDELIKVKQLLDKKQNNRLEKLNKDRKEENINPKIVKITNKPDKHSVRYRRDNITKNGNNYYNKKNIKVSPINLRKRKKFTNEDNASFQPSSSSS